MPVIKKLPSIDEGPERYQVKEGGYITAYGTSLKKAHYHAAIVKACNEQYKKNHNSTSRQYHNAIVKGIEETKADLAAKPPGAHLPKNPGAGTLALQKLAQEERDREANRRLNRTPVRMGGPSSASGLNQAERDKAKQYQEGRARFQKWVETRQKAASLKTAKKTRRFFHTNLN
jgi:hypothetical protein